jgi:3-hydroxyisobutyrate dehydrogenase
MSSAGSAGSDIGFIGVGNMGAPMATNLIKAGHRVTVFDLVPRAVEAMRERGARSAASLAEAARGREVLLTMLPAGEQVRSVYLDALAGRIDPGCLVIDCSTIDVASARAVHEALAAAGIDVLDAPVSGGIMGAAAGTLAFMVGGSEAAFRRARPLLEVMGANIIHTGGPGTGQAAKICNNMMLGIQMLAVCEGFALADRLGLARQTLFDVASKASGQSWALTSYCPVPGPVPASPANNGYKAGFTTAMMVKDLRLSQASAAETGASTRMGALATQLYEAFNDAGGSQRDFSGIFTMLRGT